MIGVCLAGVTLFGCSSASDSTPQVGRFTEADPEYKMTVIAGEPLTVANVTKWSVAFDEAEPVCQEPRERIADIVVVGKQQSDQQGASMSYLEILRAIPQSVPVELQPMKCAEVVAALVVIAAG